MINFSSLNLWKQFSNITESFLTDWIFFANAWNVVSEYEERYDIRAKTVNSSFCEISKRIKENQLSVIQLVISHNRKTFCWFLKKLLIFIRLEIIAKPIFTKSNIKLLWYNTSIYQHSPVKFFLITSNENKFELQISWELKHEKDSFLNLGMFKLALFIQH